MANPSLKNGYMQLATELVERFARTTISGNEWRLIWVVMRHTWCWQDSKNAKKKKEWDWIALSQFSSETGISVPNVAKTLKKLVSKRILDKEVAPKKRYKFNINYDEWVLSKRTGTVKLDNKLLSKRTEKALSDLTDTIDIHKENIKKGLPAEPESPESLVSASLTKMVVWNQYDALKEIAVSPNRVQQIAGLLMVRKGREYQNKQQFNEAFKRCLRPAKSLLGYTKPQIEAAIAATILQAEDLNFDWQPQTVLKNVERVVN